MGTNRILIAQGGGPTAVINQTLVGATLEPGVTVSEVSQAAGIHSSQLFRWRQANHSRDPFHRVKGTK